MTALRSGTILPEILFTTDLEVLTPTPSNSSEDSSIKSQKTRDKSVVDSRQTSYEALDCSHRVKDNVYTFHNTSHQSKGGFSGNKQFNKAMDHDRRTVTGTDDNTARQYSVGTEITVLMTALKDFDIKTDFMSFINTFAGLYAVLFDGMKVRADHKAKTLINCLRPDIQTIVAGFDKEILEDFKLLTRKLQSLVNNEDPDTVLTKFLQLGQRDSESLTAFYHRFLSTCTSVKRLHPTILTEAFILSQFIRGLTYDNRKTAISHNKSCIEELFVSLSKHELLLQDDRKPNISLIDSQDKDITIKKLTEMVHDLAMNATNVHKEHQVAMATIHNKNAHGGSDQPGVRQDHPGRYNRTNRYQGYRTNRNFRQHYSRGFNRQSQYNRPFQGQQRYAYNRNYAQNNHFRPMHSNNPQGSDYQNQQKSGPYQNEQAYHAAQVNLEQSSNQRNDNTAREQQMPKSEHDKEDNLWEFTNMTLARVTLQEPARHVITTMNVAIITGMLLCMYLVFFRAGLTENQLVEKVLLITMILSLIASVIRKCYTGKSRPQPSEQTVKARDWFKTPMQINHNNVLAVLDTGAPVSTIGEEQINAWGLKMNGRYLQFYDLTEKALDSPGYVMLTVKWNQITKRHRFRVLKQSTEIILGTDFLARLPEIVVNPQNRKITVLEENFPKYEYIDRHGKKHDMSYEGTTSPLPDVSGANEHLNERNITSDNTNLSSQQSKMEDPGHLKREKKDRSFKVDRPYKRNGSELYSRRQTMRREGKNKKQTKLEQQQKQNWFTNWAIDKKQLYLYFILFMLFNLYTGATQAQSSNFSSPTPQHPLFCNRRQPHAVWKFPVETMCQEQTTNTSHVVAATQEIWTVNLNHKAGDIIFCSKSLAKLDMKKIKEKKWATISLTPISLTTEACESLATSDITKSKGQDSNQGTIYFSAIDDKQFVFTGVQRETTFIISYVIKKIKYIATHTSFVSNTLDITECKYKTGNCALRFTQTAQSTIMPSAFEVLFHKLRKHARIQEATLIPKPNSVAIEAILIWTPDEALDCSHTPTISLEGHFGRNGFIATNKNMMLNYKLPFQQKQVKCQSRTTTLYKSQQGVWSEFTKPAIGVITSLLNGNYVSPNKTTRGKRRKKRQTLTTAELLSTQLQFLSDKTERMDLLIYKKLININCELHNSQMAHLRALIPASGTELARFILKTPNVVVTMAAQYMIVFNCVDILEYQFLPMNITCFDKPRLLAKYRGQNVTTFLNVQTMELEQNANLIGCDPDRKYYLTIDKRIYVYDISGKTFLMEDKITEMADEFYHRNIFNLDYQQTATFTPVGDINLTLLLPSEMLTTFYKTALQQQKIFNTITNYQSTVLTRHSTTGGTSSNAATNDFVRNLWKMTVASMFNLSASWQAPFVFFASLLVYLYMVTLIVKYTCRLRNLLHRRKERLRQAFQLALNDDTPIVKSTTKTKHDTNIRNEKPLLAFQVDNEATTCRQLPTAPSYYRREPKRRGDYIVRDSWPPSLDQDFRVNVVGTKQSTILEAIINGRKTPCLLDSGSQLSIIDSRLAADLGLPISKTTLHATALGQNALTMLGETNANISVANLEINMDLAVMKDGCFPILLGVDYLEKVKVDIKFRYADNLLLFGDCEVPLIRYSAARSLGKVTARTTISLPPQSQTFMKAQAPDTAKEDTSYYLNANEEFFNNKNIIAVCLIVSVFGGMLTTVLINPNRYPVTIFANTNMGDLYWEPLTYFSEHENFNINSTEMGDTSTDEKQLTDDTSKADQIIKGLHLEKCDISEKERSQLESVIRDHTNAFALQDYDLGRIPDFQLEVKTKDTSDFKPQFHGVPLPLRNELHEQLTKMQKAGIIERIDESNFISPIVLAKKKVELPNGEISIQRRFVLNLHSVNLILQNYSYPLPLIKDIFASLHEAKIFSKFDLISGYHQISLHPKSRELFTFCPNIPSFPGLYAYKVLPQGAKISCARFQQTMQEVIEDLEYGAQNYVDDFILFSENFTEHLQIIEKFLQRLTQYGLKVKVSKVVLAREEISFLGRLINAKGLSPLPSSVQAILKTKPPESIVEVQRLLGTLNFFRDFIPRYAEIARPLLAAIKGKKGKNTKIQLGEAGLYAHNIFLEALTKPPILVIPNPKLPYSLQTDASNFATGAVLCQVKDGKLRPVSFASKALSSSQQNYSALERELLALRTGLLHFRHYVYGTRISIFTDHKPLVHLDSLDRNTCSMRIKKMILDIAEFDTEIFYIQGSKNIFPDWLSRINPPLQTTTNQPEEETTAKSLPKVNVLSVGFPDKAAIARTQESDSEIAVMKKFLSEEDITTAPKTIQEFCRKKGEEFTIQDGLVYKQTESSLLLWLPSDYRDHIVWSSHQDPSCGGHLGSNIITKKIQNKFYWRFMANHVRKLLEACPVCLLKNRVPTLKPPVKNTATGTRPFDVVHVDSIGPLPASFQYSHQRSQDGQNNSEQD